MSFKNLVQRSPAASYFITTFAISWSGAFVLVAPKLLNGQPLAKMDGILMFPVMLLGPVIASLVLTAFTEGKTGLRNLWSRMGKWRLPFKWYLAALLIPPFLILAVLLLLEHFVSPAFKPNFFLLGVLFGIPAGFFEEIGWMGFAFPKMYLKWGMMKAGIVLGLLWALWHLPVIDFLGAASPHGQYLPLFFLSFVAMQTAIRLLIVFAYSNTKSILLAQLMHVISTGSLVVFGAASLSPAQETLWYALYAAVLWIIALIILRFNRRNNANA